MMRQLLIQDAIDRGRGTAARVLGAGYDVYRPRDSGNPLLAGLKILSLPVAFNAGDDNFHHPGIHTTALWHGVFDAAYTRVGDYLVGPSGIFFIAAQDPLLPVVCVRANRTISLARPAAPSGGAGSYGGVVRGAARPLLTGWPGSLLAMSGERRNQVGLPAEGQMTFAVLILPILPAVVVPPRPADLMSDDLGLAWVVNAVEQTALGWRLFVRQANG